MSYGRAELWGIYIDLKTCWDNKWKKVMVETDSLLTLSMINQKVLMLNQYSSLINAICNLFY